DDEEQLREPERPALDRHLALGHRLEERRLRPRRGAVDLVGNRIFVKIAPSWKRKGWSRWSKTDTPRMSDGRRSGVNWMRLNLAPIERASALASAVLPVPG